MLGFRGKNDTPRKAIYAHCHECMGEYHPRECVSPNCKLHPYRLGPRHARKPCQTHRESGVDGQKRGL